MPELRQPRNASVAEISRGAEPALAAKVPSVTVVIPAFNAAWCVGRAIESVLAQSFREVEVLVVDDGSTDDTAHTAGAYGPPVRVIRKRNGGMSSARNAGIREARARYIAFLDADDRWLPGKLARQVKLLEENPDIVFCAAVALLEDPHGRAMGQWACCQGAQGDLATIFANHSAVAGGASSVLARREAVLAVDGFDESLAGAEDTDFWIRLAALGAFRCVEEPLLVVLRRIDSVSRNLDHMRAGSLAMTRKNRHLLGPERRGAFWRHVYAGILCDYAKWEHREGRSARAIAHLLEALCRSPFGRGRLALSLMLAIARRQSF
ncbi:MAG TPA: glycosyltransferase family A protein [Burkholderiales bacterium]|nr:glycosyltransferase family A protein [Burkholderiales bacterium]